MISTVLPFITLEMEMLRKSNIDFRKVTTWEFDCWEIAEDELVHVLMFIIKELVGRSTNELFFLINITPFPKRHWCNATFNLPGTD